MAKSWADVTQLPQFKSLSDEEKETARDEYFYDVVAPNAKSFDEIDQLRTDYDLETRPRLDGDAGPEEQYTNPGKVAERVALMGTKAIFGGGELAARQDPTGKSFITGLAKEASEKKDDFFSMPSIPLAIINHAASEVVKGVVDVFDMFSEGDAREDLIAANEIVRKEADKALGSKPLQYTGNAGQKFGWEVAEGIINMAPALALGWATRNPGAALGYIGGQVGGMTYSDYMEKTGDHDLAMAATKFHVLAEVIPQTISVLAILKKAKVGEGTRRLLEASFGEGIQEMLTEVLQLTYDDTQLENMSLADALRNIDWAQVGHAGLLGFAVGTGLAVPGAIGDSLAKPEKPSGPLGRAAKVATDTGAEGLTEDEIDTTGDTGLSEDDPAPGLNDIETAPEPAADIEAQLEEVNNPDSPKDSVFIANDTPVPEGAANGLIVVEGESGILLTNNETKARDFENNESDETLAAILGYRQSKNQVADAVRAGETTSTLVVRNSAGSPIHQELVSESVLDDAVERLEAKYPERVEVHDPIKLLEERKNRFEVERSLEKQEIEVRDQALQDERLRVVNEVAGLDAPVLTRSDGDPFADIETAQQAGENRGLTNPAPVAVEGGFGVVELSDEQSAKVEKQLNKFVKGYEAGGVVETTAEPVEPAKVERATRAERDVVKDIPTVEVIKEAIETVGEEEFARRVKEDTKTMHETSTGPVNPVEEALRVELVARNIVALNRRKAEPLEQVEPGILSEVAGDIEREKPKPKITDEKRSELDEQDGPTITDETANESIAADIEAAANEAATSPENDLPEPTEDQKEAGNYKKGTLDSSVVPWLAGMPIAIENPAGSSRRPEWPPLKNSYGYFKRTEAFDGDEVDVFIGPDMVDQPDQVFVIDQVDPKTGKPDEHKAILGVDNAEDAKAVYLANYEKDWNGVGDIKSYELDDFKSKLHSGFFKNSTPGRKLFEKQVNDAKTTDTIPDVKPVNVDTKPNQPDKITDNSEETNAQQVERDPEAIPKKELTTETAKVSNVDTAPGALEQPASGKVAPIDTKPETPPAASPAVEIEAKPKAKGIPLTDINMQRTMNVDGKDQKVVLNASAAFSLAETRLDNLAKLNECIRG